MTPKRHSTTPHRQLSGSGAAAERQRGGSGPAAERQPGCSKLHCTKPIVNSDLSKATFGGHPWPCWLTHGATPAGRAIAKTWVSAARTPSDQGLQLRMIANFIEPASRATKWVLFALRRIEGTPRRELGSWSWAALYPSPDRRKARKQIMGRRPRPPRIPNARSTNPFDRAGHRSICKCSLLNYFVARGIFAFCLCAVLRV
jgi:hypothetical protein